MNFRRIYNFWEYLLGAPGEFSLNNRIYHAITVIVMAVMIYNVPFCLFLGLYTQALATVVLLFFQYSLYYLSRFKRKGFGRTIQLLLFYLFFAYSYFSNAGVDGSALLSLITTHFIAIVVTPRRQHAIWTLLSIAVILGLLYSEYLYPSEIENSYGSKRERLIDIASTNLMYIFLTVTCLSYIIKNYIAEKNMAEEKAARLRRLNEQQNKLISIISHDFNAPLSNINQYLRALRHADFNVKTRNKLEDELSRITTDTQNLLLNLLSWSKSNMERMDIHIGPVAVQDVLVNTLDVYHPIANDKDIVLYSDVSEGALVSGDFDMLEIVLRNLISNAVKFTEEGGMVKIETEGPENDLLKIKVTNSGIGIDPANRDLIFREVVTATSGTKKEKGAGIGLAICREFIENMGGTIGFDSEEGGSTTFFVILPSPGRAAALLSDPSADS